MNKATKLYCTECGREMKLKPTKRIGVVVFTPDGGRKRVNFGGVDYDPDEIVGRLICPSWWCRLLHYNDLTCHFDYALLNTGAVVSRYVGD